MFMLTNDGAVATATAPDMCNTPTPTGPLPMPYPNTADTRMADPGGLMSNVLVMGMPAMTLMSKVTISNGDQPGAAGGLLSGRIMGEMTFLNASTCVTVGGKPAVRVTCLTGHNGAPQNTVGMVSAPGQTKVLVMR
ncbi:type VI secretion protein [Pseudomonas antarctica]|jgi:hypothetical protein|uniref:Type VI secretion protein n=1 Tax=Pseudomonas antarctica TaxID=219572 RepID=A0A172Z184_9PSED|nr:DUF4150 domain-containing protein [Pseudomonas antarctica]ANF86257.1 type VI secretion protein [Pseudomonas antarctica]